MEMADNTEICDDENKRRFESNDIGQLDTSNDLDNDIEGVEDPCGMEDAAFQSKLPFDQMTSQTPPDISSVGYSSVQENGENDSGRDEDLPSLEGTGLQSRLPFDEMPTQTLSDISFGCSSVQNNEANDNEREEEPSSSEVAGLQSRLSFDEMPTQTLSDISFGCSSVQNNEATDNEREEDPSSSEVAGLQSRLSFDEMSSQEPEALPSISSAGDTSVPINDLENKEEKGERPSSFANDEENEGHQAEDTVEGAQVGELIADIFGESESEEEFEGFKKGSRDKAVIDDDDENDEPVANLEPNDSSNAVNDDFDPEERANTAVGASSEAGLPELSSDESGDESTGKRKLPEDFVYDFDIMMQKRKESIRRRKSKKFDIVNDSDDLIAELIQEMKQAAEDDFQMNKDRKAATRKLKLLPVVETQLRKIDLREAFLDGGVLGVITDWLTPLPDRSLPNVQVRETMLKILGELNVVDVERLKASGIGKAVMYLCKHPKETKDNKRRARQLISNWSRPIFNLESDFHSISKEEREQRDLEHMTKTKRKLSDTPGTDTDNTPIRQKTEEKSSLRPHEKGWVSRARVPMPSTRDYVVRPKSSVELDTSRSGNKKAVTRLDKHLRNFREKKKQMKTQRAVPISIEGRKMSL